MRICAIWMLQNYWNSKIKIYLHNYINRVIQRCMNLPIYHYPYIISSSYVIRMMRT
jgi:hypothetical protein